MEPTQTPADLYARLAAKLDAAIGADNGVTKADLAIALFGDDSSESKYRTAQLLAKYRRQQLELGKMYTSFHRDGDWKNAAISDPEEGSEIMTRDIGRLQSAMNGLTKHVQFLFPRALLNQAHVDAIEAHRRAIGAALLTPITMPQIAAPTQQP